LRTELVARKPENLQSVVFVMKSTQTCVLRRQSSIGGNVDDETRRAGEIAQRNLVALQGRHRKVMKSSHKFSKRREEFEASSRLSA